MPDADLDLADLAVTTAGRSNKTGIVLVNNVSVEPFRLVKPDFAAALQSEPPSRAWTLAMRGEADLAVIPVAKLQEVSPVLEPIGDYGVACRGPVRSVLLFGIEPLDDLVNRGRPIHLTTQSETSRRLLRLLCLREFGREPVFAADLGAASGRLCIGDEALHRRQDALGWPVIVDLSEWWHRQTGLPFVFARWTVRRAASAVFKRAALDWLDACVEAATASAGHQAMVRSALAAGLFADATDAAGYFRGLRSRFDDQDRRGERLFLHLLGRLHEA